MSLEKIPPVKEEGFPVQVKKTLNMVVRRSNRSITINFATDSLAAVATVLETDDAITITLPRGALGSQAQGGIDATFTVCEDDGMGGFTQKTATFTKGILTDVS